MTRPNRDESALRSLMISKMSHPVIKLRAWLGRTDESQEVEGECCLNNIVVELKVMIRSTSDGYFILWKRSLGKPADKNLEYLQKKQAELLPEQKRSVVSDVKGVIRLLKSLLKDFEHLKVAIVSPQGERLMKCGQEQEYFLYNSDCEGDEEDLKALYKQIDSLKGPLTLIKRVVLIE